MNTSAPQRGARVVLVTGASSGIGQACALHLAERGFRVFGTSRQVSGEAEGPLERVPMDVDDDASVDSGVAAVLEKAGRLDAVINNAGYSLAGPVEDTTIAEAKAQLETNFFGVLRVCRAVLPTMREQRHGYIINISSLAGVFGLPFAGLYSASKFALEGMSESLRFETRPHGIHVVLVQPGDFRTRITQRRRIAGAGHVSEAYRAMFARFHARQERDEAGAPTPEPIARLVERILNHPRPRLRYPIGLASQRIVVPLKSYLPQRVFEWLSWKLLG
ncbi:MAG: SDR family NAD(P)-dependent oxidoreductase [Planctomycetota bacterium]|nr:MAG: SDR family NAD(P)-dependent oxidoreductase [Planctomycetota bacterium]